MRVLILLTLFGASFAEEVRFAGIPIAYSSSFAVDRPRPGYEYRTSVETPSYNSHAYVHSGNEIERTVYNAPIAWRRPYTSIYQSAEPSILRTSNIELRPAFTEFRSETPIAVPAVALPATKLLPHPTVATSTRVLAPIAIEQRFASPALFRYGTPTVAPAVFAAQATPAHVIDTVVENKVVGADLLAKKSQYHTQNELGEATYGHRDQFQSHDAIQDAAGNKAGSFSYVAPDGRLLTTEYIADKDGYRVASNALPVAEKFEHQASESAPVVVEAKSRSRRSIALGASALSLPLSLLAPRRSVLYHEPLAYSVPPVAYSYDPYVSAAPLLRSYGWPTLPFRR